MRNGKGFHALVLGLAFGLAAWMGGASAVRADEGDGDTKKIEKRRVVIVKDGKPQVYESGGPLVSRGYLGIALLDLTPELRTHFGVPEDSGVMVAKVEAGSPAEKAGIKVGDILTAVDGKAMKSSWDVMGKVRTYDNSQQVPIEIWRNGKTQNVTAPIVTRERPELDIAPFFGKDGPGGENLQLYLNGEKLLGDGKWLEGGGRPKRMQGLPSSGREAELEKRLKELEKRIDELQRQLEKR